MATSLGQLLDALVDGAHSVDDGPAVRADAATALGHFGRALAHLRRDGVSPIAVTSGNNAWAPSPPRAPSWPLALRRPSRR
ncbi:hypothetical protein [Blastococcus sp. TF02-09]|uniref:hypothetical protein n=1 Tax=Blastococcus sp. TF02-09 TaxID=2250576 RepID=UPI001F3DF24B|nr:hypothetical protein [Blastococcus sp. TF02-9]